MNATIKIFIYNSKAGTGSILMHNEYFYFQNFNNFADNSYMILLK